MTRWGKVLGGAAVAVLAPLACANLEGLAGGATTSGPDGSSGGTDAGGITSFTSGLTISARQTGPKSAELSLVNTSDRPIPLQIRLDESDIVAVAETETSTRPILTDGLCGKSPTVDLKGQRVCGLLPTLARHGKANGG